ncbi:drug/metabolite transporter (DMT)-like permease [Arthrobacter sp. CAN_A212]|uniref:DMT family transporter n=1 Tax=Arthrobacter sp. CAN_A212 TaxID=2787719 RepID=UPI0018CB2FB2
MSQPLSETMQSPARSKQGRSLTVDLLLMLVAIAWGSTYWVAKELVEGGSVLAVLAVRMPMTALILGAIVLIARKRIGRRDLSVGVILGLILSTVFFFETFGIAETSATNAGLIISLTIVITPVLETIVGKRRLHRLFYAAALLAVAGVYFLATEGVPTAFGLGDGLILVAAVVRAIHVVSMHRLSSGKDVDSLSLTLVQMSTCGIVFLALATFTGDAVGPYIRSMDSATILQMLYLVIACTVFPFFIQMWAVRKTSPTRVSLLLGTEPVWAAVIGITFAGDVLGPIGIGGVLLVLFGTLWGQRLETKTEEPRDSDTVKTST